MEGFQNEALMLGQNLIFEETQSSDEKKPKPPSSTGNEKSPSQNDKQSQNGRKIRAQSIERAAMEAKSFQALCQYALGYGRGYGAGGGGRSTTFRENIRTMADQDGGPLRIVFFPFGPQRGKVNFPAFQPTQSPPCLV